MTKAHLKLGKESGLLSGQAGILAVFLDVLAVPAQQAGGGAQPEVAIGPEGQGQDGLAQQGVGRQQAVGQDQMVALAPEPAEGDRFQGGGPGILFGHGGD